MLRPSDKFQACRETKGTDPRKPIESEMINESERLLIRFYEQFIRKIGVLKGQDNRTRRDASVLLRDDGEVQSLESLWISGQIPRD